MTDEKAKEILDFLARKIGFNELDFNIEQTLIEIDLDANER